MCTKKKKGKNSHRGMALDTLAMIKKWKNTPKWGGLWPEKAGRTNTKEGNVQPVYTYGSKGGGSGEKT